MRKHFIKSFWLQALGPKSSRIYPSVFTFSDKAVTCARFIHIEVAINNQGLLILVRKKVVLQFYHLYNKKKKRLFVSIASFQYQDKISPCFCQKNQDFSFLAIFLDKVGVFYSQRHLTALWVMKKAKNQ